MRLLFKVGEPCPCHRLQRSSADGQRVIKVVEAGMRRFMCDIPRTDYNVRTWHFFDEAYYVHSIIQDWLPLGDDDKFKEFGEVAP